MIYGGLQKLTLIDFPGKLAATIFLNGCNFRCPFCYNPNLVLPEKISSLNEEEIFSFLNRRKGILDGVVICGGEPTIHRDLNQIVKRIKEMGFAVKLDTNGSEPEILNDLIYQGLLDYVAMDIKAPKEKYGILAGQGIDLAKIQESIDILKEGKTDYEFRTTVIPLLLEKEDILSIVQWIRPAKRYFLQQFRAENNLDPEFKKLNPYSLEYLVDIKEVIAPFFDVCQVRK